MLGPDLVPGSVAPALDSLSGLDPKEGWAHLQEAMGAHTTFFEGNSGCQCLSGPRPGMAKSGIWF